jgi:hypothetical protein
MSKNIASGIFGSLSRSLGWNECYWRNIVLPIRKILADLML